MEYWRKIMKILWFALIQTSVWGLRAEENDLQMGPYRCPNDSNCVETNDCKSGYYMTPDQKPYYCGPHHQIDKMICCHDPDASVVSVDNVDENSDFESTTEYEIDNNILEDPSTTNHSVFAYNAEEDGIVKPSSRTVDLPLPDLPQDGSDHDESSIEEKLKNVVDLHEEYDSRQQVQPPPHLLSPNPRHGMKNQAVRNNDIYPRPVSNSPNLKRVDNGFPRNNVVHRPLPQYPPHQIQPPNTDSYGQGQSSRRNSRQNHMEAESHFTHCPCEKGDKGERGPKGEAGTPGKVVYVPIFVPSLQHIVPNTGQLQSPFLQSEFINEQSYMQPEHLNSQSYLQPEYLNQQPYYSFLQSEYQQYNQNVQANKPSEYLNHQPNPYLQPEYLNQHLNSYFHSQQEPVYTNQANQAHLSNQYVNYPSQPSPTTMPSANQFPIVKNIGAPLPKFPAAPPMPAPIYAYSDKIHIQRPIIRRR